MSVWVVTRGNSEGLESMEVFDNDRRARRAYDDEREVVQAQYDMARAWAKRNKRSFPEATWDFRNLPPSPGVRAQLGLDWVRMECKPVQ